MTKKITPNFLRHTVVLIIFCQSLNLTSKNNIELPNKIELNYYEISNRIHFKVNTALDDASFSYGNTSYCQTESDPIPTFTGEAGGTFSSTSGLSINASTGEINLSSSTLGSYIVTYRTTAPDQNSATFNISILAGTVPGVVEYFSNNASFSNNIEYIPGNLPIIISAPHGGKNIDKTLFERGCGVNEEDNNTDILIRIIQKEIFDLTGGYPHIIINNLSRSRLDPNRDKETATCSNTSTYPYFDAYHGFIDKASAKVTADYGKGIYIDLHGQSHRPKRIDVGFNISTGILDAGSLPNTITTSTIEYLKNNNIQGLDLQSLVRGTESFGHFLQTTGGSFYNSTKGGTYQQCGRTVGYRAVPSAYNFGGCNDTTPNGSAYFAGDYYSNIRHGSGPAASESTVTGGTIGGGGVIDGMMTEVNRDVRHLGDLTAEYNRSDAKPQTITPFGKDYASSILKFLEAHYNDFSKFSYAASSYSINGLDATPTIDGISGGTFSSTSGLSIKTSTGIIDVSESTPGTYTVTYTAPNVGSYYKKEVQIKINNAAVTNEFTANSGDWSVDSNWSLARTPITNDLISIPNGKTVTIKSTGISAANVSVAGKLRINPGKSLTVTGNLTTTGTFIIKSNATSSGSLIVMGTSTGNLTYKRYIKNSTAWFMVSSPVKNQDIDTFAKGHPLVEGSGSNRGLGSYNNSSPAWEYYQDGTSNSGNFELAKGHALRFTEAKNAEFTGSLETDNLSRSVSLGANGWNLLGNPYPSFISANGAAQSTNNLIDINSNLLQSGFKAIYFWDSNEYKPFNNASSAKFVAPGQGYFVRVNASSSEGNANTYMKINENMQSHQTGDLFSRSHSDRFEINLKIMDGSIEKYTEIKYINGTTTGLDEGYDAGMFDGANNSFAVYTHLVSDSDGTNYSLQALPDSNYENMIVPVGINASANTAITFSLESIHIPSGLKIFLEDKEMETITRLDETDSSYVVNTTSDISGIGRFYIHTASEVLVIEKETSLGKISIFKTDKLRIRILGLEAAKTTLKLFTLLGKEIIRKEFTAKNIEDVLLPKLSKGVYLLQIKTASGMLNKKIIFE